MTLLDLGWEGQQGKELEAFMQNEYQEWVWNFVEGSIVFADES